MNIYTVITDLCHEGQLPHPLQLREEILRSSFLVILARAIEEIEQEMIALSVPYELSATEAATFTHAYSQLAVRRDILRGLLTLPKMLEMQIKDSATELEIETLN